GRLDIVGFPMSCQLVIDHPRLVRDDGVGRRRGGRRIDFLGLDRLGLLRWVLGGHGPLPSRQQTADRKQTQYQPPPPILHGCVGHRSFPLEPDWLLCAFDATSLGGPFLQDIPTITVSSLEVDRPGMSIKFDRRWVWTPQAHYPPFIIRRFKASFSSY